MTGHCTPQRAISKPKPIGHPSTLGAAPGTYSPHPAQVGSDRHPGVGSGSIRPIHASPAVAGSSYACRGTGALPIRDHPRRHMHSNHVVPAACQSKPTPTLRGGAWLTTPSATSAAAPTRPSTISTRVSASTSRVIPPPRSRPPARATRLPPSVHALSRIRSSRERRHDLHRYRVRTRCAGSAHLL